MNLTQRSMIVLALALLGLGCPPSKAPPPAPGAAQSAAALAPDTNGTAAASVPGSAATPPELASPTASASDSTAASAAPTAPSAGPAVASAAPMAAPTAAPVAPAALPTTIGDTTCTNDADCTVTRRLDCCDCCKGNTRATSRAWLSWRNGTLCPHTRCEPCGKVKCAYYEPAEKFKARCDHGSCMLAGK
jgi:hypothetical protein